MALKTKDGGKSWTPIELPAPPEGGKADRNLFRLFAHKDRLFVAAEKGAVLQSDDRGESWRYLNTDYKGSFWSGVALADGTLVVAGQRGTVYRSVDDGKSWNAVPTGMKSSITDLVVFGTRLVGVGLDGVRIDSSDRAASFSMIQRDDRLSFSAAASAADESVILFSTRGPVFGDTKVGK